MLYTHELFDAQQQRTFSCEKLADMVQYGVAICNQKTDKESIRIVMET